jgi:hypothetical protein
VLLASLRVKLLALILLGLYINLRVMALDPHMDQRLVFEVTRMLVQLLDKLKSLLLMLALGT